ncbi:MAG: DEAD/DEAH box helicase family protein, partial [Planctomycetota bacterium]|nr:DEAD/DEAH box helicase family protein [Planctomycetota bacterium]
MSDSALTLEFNDGTILIHGSGCESLFNIEEVQFDSRVEKWRAPAYRYYDIVSKLTKEKTPYEDLARNYQVLKIPSLVDKVPRDYQEQALEAWRANRRRGVVVLPTGAGKSFVAILAIRDRPRSTLVVAPTIDLMNQWHDLLVTYFG